jgi:hypothetical protein
MTETAEISDPDGPTSSWMARRQANRDPSGNWIWLYQG